MDSVILIELTKKFKQTAVLNGISAVFEKGKTHVITGGAGSGKSVLMKCVCGLLPPTDGRIFVNEKFIGSETDVPDRMGAAMDEPCFLPDCSAFGNLEFLAAVSRKAGAKEIRAAMYGVGLDPDDKTRAGRLSEDKLRRLGIAQAVMEDPDLIVLDDPLKGLSRESAGIILNCLRGLKDRGKTIMIFSRFADDIRELCDSVTELNGGKLRAV